MSTQELNDIASQVRRDIVRMVAGASSGHPGGSLGCADFLTTLYFDQMVHNPSNFVMDGSGEDVFYPILNNLPRHATVEILTRNYCVLLMAIFHLTKGRIGHPIHICRQDTWDANVVATRTILGMIFILCYLNTAAITSQSAITGAVSGVFS